MIYPLLSSFLVYIYQYERSLASRSCSYRFHKTTSYYSSQKPKVCEIDPTSSYFGSTAIHTLNRNDWRSLICYPYVQYMFVFLRSQGVLSPRLRLKRVIPKILVTSLSLLVRTFCVETSSVRSAVQEERVLKSFYIYASWPSRIPVDTNPRPVSVVLRNIVMTFPFDCGKTVLPKGTRKRRERKAYPSQKKQEFV